MKTLYGIYAAYSTGFNIVWKILPAFLAAFMGAFDISLVFASFFAARVFIIPIGMASDRIGPVKSMRLSFSLMTLMILGFMSALGMKSLYGWVIFAAASGIVVNLIEIAANAMASRQRKKTSALFGLESTYHVGVVLGPIIGGLLASSFGMEAALLTWAALNVLGILMTCRLPKEKVNTVKASKGLLSAIREKKFLFLMVLVFGSFMTGFIQAMQELILPLFAKNVGFDIAQIGLMIGLASVIAICGLLMIGKKADKIPRHYLLLGFYFSMLVFPATAAFFNGFFFLTAAGGIFLIGRAGSLNISRSFFSEFSDRYKATAIGIGETVYYFSRSAGSAATGLILKEGGYGIGLLSMAYMAIIALVGCIVLVGYSRRKNI